MFAATSHHPFIDRSARAVGAQLAALGPAGSRALVACPTGVEYDVAFNGCLYAGWIPVPAPAPSSPLHNERLGAIAARSGALVALTTAGGLTMGLASTPEVPWMAIDFDEEPAPGAGSGDGVVSRAA